MNDIWEYCLKALARMYVWWPGITADIEEMVGGCLVCQQNQGTSAAPLNLWSWPTWPWARLHLDFSNPFLGWMFLILIDAHSKWIETFITSLATSTALIGELRTTFTRFGLPETIGTDNGTCFVSAEFEEFLKKSGICHITSALYHPVLYGS